MKTLLKLVIVFSTQYSYASEPKLRTDLQKVTPLACKFASTYEYWKKGVYDSQISVAVYQIKSNTDKIKLERIVSDQLKLENHRGYFTGECEKDRIFIVSTPSPVHYGDERLKTILADTCQKFSIDQLSLRGVSSPTDFPAMIPKDNFSTALTCRLDHSNQEWFLLPPSNWQAIMTFSPAPSLKNKKLTQESAEDKIYQWINEKRRGEKLTQLKISDGLNQAAKNLNKSPEILHNRKAIQTELLDLRTQTTHKDTKVLIEDRVEATSLDEAQNLLWWSPKHRDLLLSPKITRIGISAQVDSERIKISLLGAS